MSVLLIQVVLNQHSVNDCHFFPRCLCPKALESSPVQRLTTLIHWVNSTDLMDETHSLGCVPSPVCAQMLMLVIGAGSCSQGHPILDPDTLSDLGTLLDRLSYKTPDHGCIKNDFRIASWCNKQQACLHTISDIHFKVTQKPW
jgi:hypothetical protein